MILAEEAHLISIGQLRIAAFKYKQKVTTLRMRKNCRRFTAAENQNGRLYLTEISKGKTLAVVV